MSLFNLLVLILVLGLVGVVPAWPHSSSWGYYPSGFLVLMLVVVLVISSSRRLKI